MTPPLLSEPSIGSIDSTVAVPSLESHVARLAEITKVEAELAFERAKIGRKIEALHNKGVAPQVASVFKGKGAITVSHAGCQALQSEALSIVPTLAKSDTPIGGDYLEITARQMKRLDETLWPLVGSRWMLNAINRFTADEYRRKLAHRIDRIDSEARRKEAEQSLKDSRLTQWTDMRTGEYKSNASYPPEMGESISKAINAEMRRMASRSDTDCSLDKNLAALALYNLIMAGSASNGHGTWGNKRYQPKPSIEVVVDYQTAQKGSLTENGFCETSMGNPIAVETLNRHMCDATIRKIELDESGIPINVGRKYRTATEAQISAARSIYSQCGWADCSTRFDWCQMHHIEEWQQGGATDFENLVPLCNEHHHKVHEGKWSIQLKPDRSLEHYQPDGKHWKTSDPPTRKPSRKVSTEAAPWAQPDPILEEPL